MRTREPASANAAPSIRPINAGFIASLSTSTTSSATDNSFALALTIGDEAQVVAELQVRRVRYGRVGPAVLLNRVLQVQVAIGQPELRPGQPGPVLAVEQLWCSRRQSRQKP